MEWILQIIQDYWGVFAAFIGSGVGSAIILSVLHTMREIARSRATVAQNNNTAAKLQEMCDKVDKALVEITAFETAVLNDPKNITQLGVFERTRSKINREKQSVAAIANAKTISASPSKKKRVRIKAVNNVE